MAEGSVQFLLEKIDLFLTKELGLDQKLKSGIDRLKDELEVMAAVLQKADNSGEQNPEISDRVRLVQDRAFDIENILDEFSLHNHLEQPAGKFKKWLKKHSIAKLIDDVEGKLRHIKDMTERYDPMRFSSGASSSSFPAQSNANFHPRIAPLFLEDAQIVGIEEDKDKLIAWTLDESHVQMEIFVVGMGGSGKTTLVKQVYEAVKEYLVFDCHAWVSVSNSSENSDILPTLLDLLCNSTEDAVPRPLQRYVDPLGTLRKFLQGKRYLIVLDDLWLKDVWEYINLALPRGQSSRIIITTRRCDIAYSSRDESVHVHNIQHLPLDKAKNLLHKTAFPKNGRCPPALESCSDDILRKCEGLPLAITEIGKILSAGEKSVSEWKILHDNLVSELRSNARLSNITRVLISSYNDLPYHLKYCFLFMNVFPEGYTINTGKLLRLWIAEGFIKEQEGKELEDVGEKYLKELIGRSLVQVSEVDFDGRPKACRVHYIMHAIVLSKLQDQRFCVVCSEGKEHNIEEKTRRLSIQTKGLKISLSSPNLQYVRTLLMLGPGTLPLCYGPDAKDSSFKLMKTLDLQGATLDAFPKEIEGLLLLRYLSLRNTRIEHVPKFIGKLRHLETLDLKQTFVTTLPKEISNLKKLRHLFVYRYDIGPYVAFESFKGFEVPAEVSALANLQKLSYVKVHRHHKLIPGIRCLKKLRKLGILDLSKEDGNGLCEAIQKLQILYSLNITSLYKEEILDIEEMADPPQLQRLYLKGKLETMPNWISKLHNLKRLRLKWSRLPERRNPVEILQDLPSLQELQLLDAYIGSQLVFRAGKFPKLKILEFELLQELRMVIMESRTLPCLQKLIIRRCSQLRQVPVGIKDLSCLEELHLCDMPENFVGQFRHFVHHIPIIRSYYSQQH